MAFAITSDVWLKIYQVPKPICGMVSISVPFNGVGLENCCVRIGLASSASRTKGEYILTVPYEGVKCEQNKGLKSPAARFKKNVFTGTIQNKAAHLHKDFRIPKLVFDMGNNNFHSVDGRS
jgi:hypothetical protein